MDRIDPADDQALTECAAVIAATDRELWPDEHGFSRRDLAAFARFEGATRSYVMLGARDTAIGPVVGVALLEIPLLDNLHSFEVTVDVHPAQRRRGVGSALVAGVERWARANGRRTINALVDVPVAQSATHASRFFAPKLGFAVTLGGNSRRLDVPLPLPLLEQLRQEVADAKDAQDYRTLTFEAPWPPEFLEDQCELFRIMSVDEPAGDVDHEEELYNATRIEEHDRLRRDRGATKLSAVVQHLPSGRLVAMSELLVSEDDAPHQSRQLVTVVHHEHRGHRLGLAVKLANLAFLAERAPAVAFIITGNASSNAPMIAVNDMMGFVVQGQANFWQKHLDGA